MELPLSTVDHARRRFLISSLVGLLVGIRPYDHCHGSTKQDPPRELPWWLRLTGERDAVLRFGNAYLRSHPEDSELEVLLAEIEKTIPIDGEPEPAATSQAAYIAMLQRQVRNDYRCGALVSVSSWLLSRTEARLYAAAALFYHIEQKTTEALPAGISPRFC